VGALVDRMPRLQVERIGIAVRLHGVRQVAEQLHAQLAHDFGGDLILDGEHVVEVPVPGFRPEMRIRVHLDELGRDAYLVARLANAAFENVRNVQLPADIRDLDVLPLVEECGRA